MPRSGMVVLPRMTQPASRTRAVGGESSSDNRSRSAAAVPTGAGMPRTATLSLMVIGTPSKGERGCPGTPAPLGFLGGPHGPFPVDQEHRVDGRLDRLDPRQDRRHDLDRRQLALPIGGAEMLGAQLEQALGHGGRSLPRWMMRAP